MPILSCHVDDRTFSILEREARERGRTVADLAEAAIENEAINADADRPMPAGQRHLALSGPDDLGGQPFHHALAPDDAEKLKGWIGEELSRDLDSYAGADGRMRHVATHAERRIVRGRSDAE